MKNVSDKSVEKIKTHFMFKKFFFLWKIVPFMRNVEKYCRAAQATDDNTARALCMLGN
jgi:hypothetical protein